MIRLGAGYDHLQALSPKHHDMRTHNIVVHDWTTILNKGQGQVDVILLDFSKAFDTVPHQRLLQKLRKYGIRNHTLNWISSFLTNRTRYPELIM